MAYPRFRRARAHKVVNHTSGNIAVTSTTFGLVAPGFEITLAAQPGDTIECGMTGQASNEGVELQFDVHTTVSGTAVNRFGGTGVVSANGGVGAWKAMPSNYFGFGGTHLRVLTAAEIVTGQVTLRLVARITTAGTRTIFASGPESLHFFAKNLGPADTT